MVVCRTSTRVASEVLGGVLWRGLSRLVPANSGRKCKGTRARSPTGDSAVATRPCRFPGIPRIVSGRLLLANQAS
ncbi:hypothetical protein RISK_005042 [Rhodopirellula islandica]|uniref:Uncharacterized protein n=1 Tax=Rhodopirellula islandica TaxID=595434 RepID=A0A0J1B8G2_RHOIS|nr:hypothetical protein RISK_005042 [Rhodopirellula islandica]